jgi:hypothetical protein
MAKFNEKNSNTITNHEGTTNYKKRSGLKGELADLLLTSMLNGDLYYETEHDRLKAIDTIVTDLSKEDEDFVLKAMAYGRNVGYLRSVSHAVAVSAIRNIKGNPLTKKALQKTLIRPDDATEIVALWEQVTNNAMIPNSLRKAIKGNIENKWDAYQFRKYYGNGKVKIPDLIKLSHPTPKTDEQSELFKNTIKGKKFLPKIETAQTINAETNSEDRATTYINSIKNRKLGYMAMLKNIDKFIDEINNDNVQMICDYITDEKLVAKSKVLPKRFLQAYYSIKETTFNNKNKVLESLEKAFILRSKDVKVTPDNKSAGLLIDTSGSMSGEPLNNAVALAGQLIAIHDDIEIYAFATEYKKLETFGLSPFAFIDKYFDYKGRYSYDNDVEKVFIPKFDIGWGTEIVAALKSIFNTNLDYVFILTDMQIYNTHYFTKYNFAKMYSKTVAKTGHSIEKIVFWDMSGYRKGTPMQTDGDKVVELAGYSDKMIELLPIILDGGTLVKEIDNYKV